MRKREILYLLFFLGCGYGVKKVNYILLYETETMLAYPKKKEMVFYTEKDFHSFWKSYCRVIDSQGGKVPPPSIDFSKNMVIAVFMGKKPTSGYRIEIEKIEEDKNYIKVYVKEYLPSKNAILMPVITYPFVMVKLKKTLKPVKFFYLKS